MASVLACMFFAAVSGSSPATVVAIGSIVIAGMVQQGYSMKFASGVICTAGTLGILIPPSIVMVVYAAATNQSVGRLFMAGVVPGLLAGLLLMGGIYIAARKLDLPRQPRANRTELSAALRDSLWGLSLIVVIMGGIYGGIFTPTEAAAVAAVYAFFIACFIYRDMGPLKEETTPARTTAHGFVLVGLLAVLVALGGLSSGAFSTFGSIATIVVVVGLFAAYAALNRAALPVMGRALWQTIVYLIPAALHHDTRHVMIEAAKTTIMLMFIITNAMLFAHVLTTERIPYNITQWIIGAGFEWWSFLIVVNILLLLAGNFMEPSAILLIMAPILFPIATQLDIDPIHLGIIMVVNMEIGMITPPVGLNLFVTAGITGMPVLDVVKAAAPWLGLLLLFLIVVTYIPVISIGLPDLLYGR